MGAQIGTRARKVDLVMADLVAEEPPGGAVMFEGNGQAAGQVAQPRDHDERDGMLALAPADPADLVVRDEHRVRPDAVLVKTAADAPVERDEVAVVEKHHDLPKRLLSREDQLVEDQDPQNHAEPQRHAIVRRRGARPDEQRVAPPPHESHVLQQQAGVRDEEAGAQQQARNGKDIHEIAECRFQIADSNAAINLQSTI